MTGTRWCDNLDGTVTDMLGYDGKGKCLVWLQKADWGGLKPWWNSSTDCSDPDYTCYDDAHKRAGILTAGTSGAGLSDDSVEGDWRLPTKTELYGLAHGDEAVSSGTMRAFTGVGVQSSLYWSSTTYASDPYYAWSVNVSNGVVNIVDKDYYYDYVWPVRSGN